MDRGLGCFQWLTGSFWEASTYDKHGESWRRNTSGSFRTQAGTKDLALETSQTLTRPVASDSMFPMAPWMPLGPWGLPRGVLGDQTGTQGWTGTSLALGTQEVPKVCNRLQKQAWGQARQREAAPDSATSRGF